MLTAPWIKRIELQTGEKTSMPLRRDVPFHTAHVEDDSGAFAEHVMFDGTSWFHVRRRGKQWLLHGSVASSGSALYIFMEHPEARHPELEAALSRDAHAAEVYADWLAEQGDPFGGALIPALAKERGPAGLWWMEGFERNGALTVTQRDGFVREAVLGPIQPDELLPTMHRLCHVRALVALERLRIDPTSFRGRPWSNVFSWTMWTDCQWPRSLSRLAFGGRQGLTRPTQEELKAFQEKMSRKHPSLVIEA